MPKGAVTENAPGKSKVVKLPALSRYPWKFPEASEKSPTI
jgi:hypothetical protein